MAWTHSAIVGLILGLAAAPSIAHAGPAEGGASFSTSKGASSSGSGSGYDWPEIVVSGNAISFLAPLQIGMYGYLPKARFSFQYDRQIRKSHWIFAGISLVADRAGFKNFRMDDCGLGTLCGQGDVGSKGGVFGFDLYGGYAYKFYLAKKPWLVPIVRGALGFSFFSLPKVGGGDDDRHQSRTKSWTLHLKPGGGVRIFPWQQLGFGGDLNLPLGFLVHTDVPMAGIENKKGAFLIGIEILPIVVEYRF